MNKIAEELISDGKSYHEAINIIYSKTSKNALISTFEQVGDGL